MCCGCTALAKQIRVAVWRDETNSLTYFDNFKYETVPVADVVAADINAIALGDLSNVTADMALPAIGSVYQSDITWTTQSDGLVIENGYAKPLLTNQPQNATLTATISRGGIEVTRDFAVTIPAGKEEDMPLYRAYNALTFDSIRKENQFSWAIEGNLDFSLEEAAAEGVEVSWTAQPGDIINTDTGAVTRGYDDENVTLTAVLSANGNRLSKSFDLCVLRQGNVLFADNFSSGSAYIQAADGVAMHGLNGWEEEVSENAAATLKTVDRNRVAQLQRTAPIAKPNHVLKHSFNGAAQENKTVIFESDLYFNGGDTFFNIYIRAITEKKPSGTSAIEMAFDYSRNNIWIKTTQNPTYEITRQLPPRNQWFHLRLEVNLPTQTFDAYLDDQQVNSVPLQFLFADDGADVPDRAKSIAQVL